MIYPKGSTILGSHVVSMVMLDLRILAQDGDCLAKIYPQRRGLVPVGYPGVMFKAGGGRGWLGKAGRGWLGRVVRFLGDQSGLAYSSHRREMGDHEQVRTETVMGGWS